MATPAEYGAQLGFGQGVGKKAVIENSFFNGSSKWSLFKLGILLYFFGISFT